MKRKLLYLFCGFLMLTLSLSVHSCSKENHAGQQGSRLVPLRGGAKTENQYWMFCAMGHDGSRCPGCITINGKRVHIDCQGAGDACLKATRITLQYSVDSVLTASTLDTFGLTNLNILNMPARSFSLEFNDGVYVYLNIPGQMVYRDATTQQFTFTGLSLTSSPLY